MTRRQILRLIAALALALPLLLLQGLVKTQLAASGDCSGCSCGGCPPTSTPTSVPVSVSAPLSADEQREQALGIFRPGIDTSLTGGTNSFGAVAFLWTRGDLAGSLEFSLPINGGYVQVAFFGPNFVAAAANSPQTLNGLGTALGWKTILSPSSKGGNWRMVEIFNPAGALVAKFEIKIS